MITDTIHKLVDRIDLDEAEARSAMEDLMTGQATDAQVAGFLTALRMKGETAGELVAFARVMREKAEPFWDGEDSQPCTPSSWTPAAQAATGRAHSTSRRRRPSSLPAHRVRVAKHGNRSASSMCGSADVLEALGVDIQMPLDLLRKAVMDVGIGFLFAQRFHRSMKHVMPARTQLKLRTVFNLIGPLANPALPQFQVLGVSSPDTMELVAQALVGLKTDRALVVHSDDGLDEISISAPTKILEIRDGGIQRSVVTPESFGVAPATLESLRGGDARTNATIIEGILKGERGPRRDVVLMNAAGALMVCGCASSLREGFRLAENSIDTGEAFRKLQLLREMSS